MAGRFTLHPHLESDTAAVCDLALCTVRLMNDSRFPWLILVPRRDGAREIHRLTADDRRMLIEEISRTAEVLERVSKADKMNVGALGNMVPQLHVHVIARFEGDAAWPGPVWGAGVALAYSAQARNALIAGLMAGGLQELVRTIRPV